MTDAPCDPESRRIYSRGISRRVVLRGIGGLVAVPAVAVAVHPMQAIAVAAGRIDEPPLIVPSRQSVVDSFVGSWTYRSFINDPDPALSAAQLLFGQGELTIDAFAPGSFAGRLIFGGGAELPLTGASTFGNPFAVRFQGVGEVPPVDGWIYDYVGYLVPDWPNGVDQRPAIVGSVVRTAPHDGNPAGVVASWIAVKRD